MSALTSTQTSPYVGPRAFERGERLFGRDQELAELVDLVIAERIVLLYSPSGAGKTSLLRASLAPELEREGFRVLPEIRVTAEPDALGDGVQPRNRYLMSTLLSLEKDVPADRRRNLDELAGMTLTDYLSGRNGEEDSQMLILDQFEELLTADVTDHDAKASFVAELGAALRDRRRWAIIAMREDFIAGLDPFLRLLPTRLRTTFRLDLLGEDAARTAIQGPAREAGVDFSDGAAQMLVDNLRRVRVPGPDGSKEVLGPCIEPVQLQVVCKQLWDRLPPDTEQITVADVEGVADIDRALASYYTDKVHAVATQTGADERVIRDWFDRELISGRGFRSQVIDGPAAGAADGERVLRLLEDARLVRAEARGGARWFELVHDRLIEPVRESNAEWRKQNLQPFQLQTELWKSQGRPDGSLLKDEEFTPADRWVDEHPDQLTSDERQFLAASRRARDQRRHGQRARRFMVVSALVCVLMLVAVLAMLYLNRQARSRELAAVATAQTAVDPAAAIDSALQAYDAAATPEAQLALRRALPESHLRTIFSGPATAQPRAAFSPDGHLVVTASGDTAGPVQVWNTTTGEQVTVLDPKPASAHDPIRAVTFDPQGSRIVTASRSQARVWDAGNGQLLRTLDHPALVVNAGWSFDGTKLVTASVDHVVRVWNAETGVQLGALNGHTDRLTTAVFSPAGQRVLTAARDGTVRVWDPHTGHELAKLGVHTGPVLSAAFNPDGTRVITVGADGTAYLWEWATDHPPIPLPGHRRDVVFAQFSPDGRYAVTAGDRMARLWDARTGVLVAELRGHTDRVNVAEFSPDSTLVITAGSDGTVRIYSVSNGVPLAQLRGHSDAVTDAMFAPSPDPFRVKVLTASLDGTARVWEPLIGRMLSGYKDRVYSADFNTDGTLVVAAGADGVARIWQAETGQELAAFPASSDALRSAVFSRDGRYVATGGYDGVVRVWDAQARTEKKASVPVGLVTSVEFDPSSRFVAIAGADDIVRVWEWGADKPLRFLRGHHDVVLDAAFNRAGTRLVTASRDKTARVWDTSTGKPLRTLAGHTGFVYSAAFSPDGKVIVTAGGDSTARTWDAATGRELKVLRGHTSRLNDAAFSPTGERIVTGAAGGVTGVWDTATGRPLGFLRVHADLVGSAQFSPDGRSILTASHDQTVRLYDCETCSPRVDEVLKLARERQHRLRGALVSPQVADGVSFDSLAAGDCFNYPSTKVACAEPHQIEVFAVLEHPAAYGQPFDDHVVARYAGQICQHVLFERSGGKNRGNLSSWGDYPPAERWVQGDRRITCVLGSKGDATTTA